MRVVKSLLQRCADVVGFMAAAPGPCGISAIAHALELPKSATHRLLREMCSIGWAQQDGEDGPYALTLRFALLGYRVLQASGLPDLVQPLLDDLAKQARELVRLTTVTRDGLIWIAAAQGAPPGLLYQPAMGDAVVLHATANGKAFLATFDDETALAIAARGGLGTIRRTARSLASPDALRADLADVRRRGYATALGEAEDGITAVAGSIPTVEHDAVFGTVSVAGPTLRIPPARIPDLAGALADTARNLAAIWPASARAATNRSRQ